MVHTRIVPLLLLATACGTAAPAPAPAVDRDAFLQLGIAHSFAPPLPQTFCSGQMTPEQFDLLPGLGIRRVISLRREGEDGTGWEEARAQKLGLEFVRIPVGGADDLTDANLDRFESALTPEAPTLVACGSSNRVGAMFALKAQRDGNAPEQALRLGKECGLTRLEPAVRQKLGLGQ